jgi:hypothetical protein
MEKKTNHPVKKYPVIGACGLDCGLCPGYHRDGKSRCNGCGSEANGDVVRGCGLLTCCAKTHGLETCGECVEMEFCPRIIKLIDQAKQRDSIISYLPITANFEFVRKNGTKKWVERENAKITFLDTLLEDYNDGRSKTFYCLSIQLLPLEKLKPALAQAQKKISEEMTPKEKAIIVRETFNELAAKSGIELKLRK